MKNIREQNYDVAVIGAGAAGLSAAAVTGAAGRSTLVIDREKRAGGILRQCIHNGFGLRYFKEELTGPEYAERVWKKARSAGADFALASTVTELKKEDDGTFLLTLLSEKDGVRLIRAKSVLLAMGCRERNRGSIATPGTRPAGIFTAGAAQKLLNKEGKLPGKSAVIVGSGDIGLIMARRLRWCGIDVKAVVEIMSHPSGLTRNIVQCLNDFHIPLHLSYSVVRIEGKDRVSGVEIAPLKDGIPQMAQSFHIDCDTVLFSVGLVPENEIAVDAGVILNPSTGGAKADADNQTNIPGIFAAGNVLHVHDLVDYVSEEAERTARGILNYLDGQLKKSSLPVVPGANLKYVIPNTLCPGKTTLFSFRPLIVTDGGILKAELDGRIILEKKIPFVRPAEMIQIQIEGDLLTAADPASVLTFSLERGNEPDVKGEN